MRLRRRNVSDAADETIPISATPSRVVIISTLGVTQIFAWGSSYYLPAVLAKPVAADTGWSLSWVVSGVSLGLLIAGLASPWVGRAIARHGGRPVLAVSAGLLASGLLVCALAQALPVYLLGWLVIGLGMGAGLYDPAFATLGRLYGHGGRSAITTLTLFGGFASTICWPLSAFLEAHLRWRGACLVYAGFQLAVALPAYLFILPRESRRPNPPPTAPTSSSRPSAKPDGQPSALFPLLAVSITVSAVISTLMSVYLLTVLQAKGLTLAAAVGFGALVGPVQVAARSVEIVIARRHHPIWTHVVSALFVLAGLAALWLRAPVIALALALYGAGVGLESIARGTLPLAIFGAERYPVVMGRIAMPSLIVQAAAPSIGSVLLASGGADGAMAAFVATAAVNVLLAASLLLLPRCASPARSR